MTSVKWIKIVPDIFDDEKMQLIEALPEADTIIVIWFKLLCLAGRQNNSGVIMLNDRIPYTDEMLSQIFRRKKSQVQLALKTFEEYEMIKIVEGVVTIPNWSKYQNQDALETARNKAAQRVAAYRERQKLLASKGDCNVTCNGEDVTPCNVTVTLPVTLRNGDVTLLEEDIDKDIDIEKEKEVRGKEREGVTESVTCNASDEAEPPPTHIPDTPVLTIKDLYHATCVSFPRIKAVEGTRLKAVQARWRAHPDIMTFNELFTIAEASDFLKGENKKNWHADFDWLMQPNNFNKVLEHKYDNKPEEAKKGKKDSSFDTEEFFNAAVNKKKKGKENENE